MPDRLTPSLLYSSLLCSLLASCASLGTEAVGAGGNEPTTRSGDARSAAAQDEPRAELQSTATEDKPEQSGANAGAQGAGRTLVTTRKRSEDLLEVPRSVTSIDAKRIEAAGLQNIKDASYLVPNVLVPEFTSRRLSFPYVRGIGSGQGEPAVANFIDGVQQLTVNSTNLPLTDVERIEFNRGPQSTLYGRNTIGGAISVVTQKPTNEMRVDSRLSLGNFGFQEYEARFQTPLIEDGLYLGASIVHSRRDGYTENDLLNEDADSRDSWFGRAQLLWTPDDRNELRFVFHGERARDGGFVLSELNALRASPNRINQDFAGKIDRDIYSNSLVWTHEGDDLDVTSITSVQRWDIGEDADFDFSQIDGVRRFTREDQTAITQEFRVSSAEDADIELGDDLRLRWLAGVNGYWADSDRSARNVFRPGGAGILFPPSQVGTDFATGDFDDYAVGVFGQATLLVGKALEVTGALRYDYEKREADLNRSFTNSFGTLPTSSSKRSESFDAILPRLSIAYAISDDVRPYVVAARGFKAGGFNLTAPSGFESFDLEKSWTYELGVKTDWKVLDLVTTLSVFHIDWEDMQLSQFDASTGGFVANAGESQSQGIELEAQMKPLEGLSILGGIGLLDTEFDRFRDSFGTDVAGRSLPFAPDFTGNIGAQYSKRFADDLMFRVAGEWVQVGKFFYDASNLGQERYGLANFRAAVGDGRWDFEVWIRNAFDQRYQPIAFQANPANPNFFVGESSAPRTVGMTFRVRLGGKKRKAL